MSIAVNIVDLAISHSQTSEGGISLIEVEIGRLAGVMQEALLFCFEAASRDTRAEGAILEIIPVAGKAQCIQCDAVIEIDQYGTLCPDCSSILEIIAGDGLRLRAITIEDQV